MLPKRRHPQAGAGVAVDTELGADVRGDRNSGYAFLAIMLESCPTLKIGGRLRLKDSTSIIVTRPLNLDIGWPTETRHID